MATALGNRTWRTAERGASGQAPSRPRCRVACRSTRENVEKGGSTDGSFLPLAAASLATAALLCSTDLAIAEEVDLAALVAGGKRGVLLTEPKRKSSFGPSPPAQPDAPKPVTSPPAPAKPEVKKKVPPPPAKKPARAPVAKKAAKKAPIPKPPSAPLLPKPKPISKPKLPAPAAAPIAPAKPATAPLPSFSLPSVPATSRDTTEAAVVVGAEILLVLIASSVVGGLLKKA